jgi:mRNA-degrading endonuclease RelE of RelBE toxin-antitoxin system
MHSLEIRKSVEKTLQKLSKKNPRHLAIIGKKLAEILQNPQHYKNLNAPLQHVNYPPLKGRAFYV